ncbi:zinc finger MYM-type protein 1-like [Homalodisca vitripennis]|uniref:zinc finger MYM-type protein 1-like n=1 Tax=Homalodisca vitripennis TaxID=197043 RepID=UPI001EEB681D|nr:zinc finger MYM-type protein 1-like [Homalodisca vitripennis]
MEAIVQTVILCGRQGLALRGNNDTGRIVLQGPDYNDGNFRALLRYRAATDVKLKLHLEHSPKNAMYISNRIQNEIISICNQMIQKQLINKINDSKAFTLMADELADISGVEQISICIRYVSEDHGKFKICEDFLSFIPTTQLTGKGLADVILSFLETSQIDCMYFFGQCYDGARNMSGEFHGAQAYIQEKYNLALYSHCAAHSFNLVVSDACKVVPIRHCLGTIQSVYNFFNYPKRLLALQDAIARNDYLRDDKKKKLKQSCTTRWVEQHESVGIYFHLQPEVIDALEVISSSWTDSKTTQRFSTSICNRNLGFSDFIKNSSISSFVGFIIKSSTSN